ncbi:MAG: hypothetical protein ACO3NL_03320 [Phycisphaerales bacterium]
MTSRSRIGYAVVVILATTSVSMAGGNSGFFKLLGAEGLFPADASADGRVVAGYNSNEFWYWTPEQGVVLIGGLSPSAGGAGSAGISNDGARIGLTTLNPKTGKTEGAFHEVATGETTLVGNFGFSCDASAMSCWGISGDGTTMVGLGWHQFCAARAFRFSTFDGLVDLGSTVSGASSRANACNDDGSVVVGWQDSNVGARQGAIWRDGAQTLITTSSGAAVGEAGAVSGDGQWVIGLGAGTNGSLGWRWSESEGLSTLPASPIPTLPRAFPTGISQDGRRIVLFYRTQFPPATAGEGYLWIDGTIHSLEILAEEQGIEIPAGVRMALPLGMSGDGYTIVGTARTPNGIQGFILDLPRPESCQGDLDDDGAVGPIDLSIMLGAWGTDSIPADLDGDGIVGPTHLATLLGAWGPCDR